MTGLRFCDVRMKIYKIAFLDLKMKPDNKNSDMPNRCTRLRALMSNRIANFLNLLILSDDIFHMCLNLPKKLMLFTLFAPPNMMKPENSILELMTYFI